MLLLVMGYHSGSRQIGSLISILANWAPQRKKACTELLEPTFQEGDQKSRAKFAAFFRGQISQELSNITLII